VRITHPLWKTSVRLLKCYQTHLRSRLITWQYCNENENSVASIHSYFAKRSGGTTAVGPEHATERYEIDLTTNSQCWSARTLPLSAPWTFCRTACQTPGPIYPRTRDRGCAVRADPGRWRFPFVPLQHCNTHRHASHVRLSWRGHRGSSEVLHRAGALWLR